MSFPPTVGRYRIDRVLGSGAFASVWLGHDDALDAHVAIKVLSGSLIDDLDVRNRFLEEARILRRADSERLVRVHDIGELPDGRPYFVMSYADRGTLADRMRERPLPVFEAVVLAEEIAYGVEVINALGVIHRDLKPSNVLFQSTRDGGEKLLIADLGLAKALAHASGAFTLPVGTPGYMSPEQARFGGGLDVRADVYGLGALTYHMLTGRPPGPAPVKVPPSALREGMPPGFDQVILRALEVEREKRWPTAEAFAEALSTLRPTMPPGTQAPMYAAETPDLDSTVQDQYVGPQQPAGPAESKRQVAGPGQAPQPGHTPSVPHPGHAPGGPRPAAAQQPGQYGPPGGHGHPAAHQRGGGFAVEPEPPTREDRTASDDIRTSEMQLPSDRPGPREGADDEKTIVDQPGQMRPPGPQYGPGGLPGSPDDDRTVAVPIPAAYQAPPGPGPQQQPADEDKTTVLPTQQPPYGGGGPQHGQGPLPTGFQPPQPGPGQQPRTEGGGPLGRLKRAGRTGGAQPGGDGRKNKLLTPMIIAAVVLSIALIGGLLLGTLFNDGGGKKSPKPSPLPQDFVQVADSTGKIKLAVPNAWPLQSAEKTWSTSIAALTDPKARPVLRATPNAAAFKGDGQSPGVFVGLTTDLAAGKLPPPGLIGHAQCTKGAREDYVSPDKALTGTIIRFTACKIGTPSVTEVGLRDKNGTFGAWVRIKETDNRNLTRTILDSLKLTAPE
ncbi:hypothetical protein GCM10010411_60020 [Actinomadura fulvescens]|uniref:non-specific serine/threonine protein kinase n=1 Tax=Actinomadura fulvescens TaxID=46160 RepID=A0ABP6CEF5_9ACTN